MLAMLNRSLLNMAWHDAGPWFIANALVIGAHEENVRLVFKGPAAGERDCFDLPVQHLRLGRAPRRFIVALCYAVDLVRISMSLNLQLWSPSNPRPCRLGNSWCTQGVLVRVSC